MTQEEELEAYKSKMEAGRKERRIVREAKEQMEKHKGDTQYMTKGQMFMHNMFSQPKQASDSTKKNKNDSIDSMFQGMGRFAQAQGYGAAIRPRSEYTYKRVPIKKKTKPKYRMVKVRRKQPKQSNGGVFGEYGGMF